MFGDKKDTQEDLKDSSVNSIKDSSSTTAFGDNRDNERGLSYTKTDKLITALYMVTDIIDKNEPIRNKLRTLGLEILSDIHFMPVNIRNRTSEAMSVLDIACAINIISEMNYNILKKEFLKLDQSIKESTSKSSSLDRQINISRFFEESASGEEMSLKQFNSSNYKIIGPYTSRTSKGHPAPTRIGIQKGGTLLRAIKDMSNRIPVLHKNNRASYDTEGFRSEFDILKKQRREDIIKVIKNNGGVATITDIKNGAHGALVSCGEKTLQRELVSMVKDNVLNKNGEKRWSRYLLKMSN